MRRVLFVVITIAMTGEFALGASKQSNGQPLPSMVSRTASAPTDSTARVVKVANAIGIDSSKSMLRYFAEVRTEVAALTEALGNADQVILISIDSSAHTLFTHELDAQSRAALIEKLTKLIAAGQSTDLGAGLESIRVLTWRGKKRVFVFTDGNPQVARGSKFYNRSFEQLLNDRTLVPDDVAVYVRLYGTAALKIERPNVKVLQSAPNWKSILAEGSVPVTTNSDTSAPAKSISAKWWLGGIATALITVLSVLIAWRMRKAERVRKAATEAEEKMRLPIEMVQEEKLPEVPEPVFRPRVVIEAAGTTRSAVLDQEHRELKIGDSWDADIFIDGCAGSAAVRVSGSDNQSRLPVSVENLGNTRLSIGTLGVEPGRSQLLPYGYVEIRLGNTVFRKIDQLVEVTSSE